MINHLNNDLHSSSSVFCTYYFPYVKCNNVEKAITGAHRYQDQIWFYKKLKNVSCEYDRLNGWNSPLQAAWYIRHVRIIWFLWTKPTMWLILSFTRNIVRACSMFYHLMKDIGRWLPWMLPGSTGRFSVTILRTDTITGVNINQDLTWCVKTGVYMGFSVHRGSWLLRPPVIYNPHRGWGLYEVCDGL